MHSTDRVREADNTVDQPHSAAGGMLSITHHEGCQLHEPSVEPYLWRVRNVDVLSCSAKVFVVVDAVRQLDLPGHVPVWHGFPL